jgi:DNA polymerase zeta
VRQWYDDMPKVRRIHRLDPSAHRKTLESYMSSASCVACGAKTRAADVSLCDECGRNVPASLVALNGRLAKLQRGIMDVDGVCRSCAGLGPLEEVFCDSKDCPVYYTRVKEGVRLRAEKAVVDPVIEKLLSEPARLEW